jgi:transposase
MPGDEWSSRKQSAKSALIVATLSVRSTFEPTTHKHDDVTEWLAQHPRFHIHYTPTSSSWLNLVERWFRELTQKRLRRGNFTGVKELVTAIKEYLAQNNKQPKPFVWAATAQQIIDKVNRCKGISETLH